MESTATKPDTRKDVYTEINDRIIEQLNKGTVPWRKPWTDAGLPQNLISKKYYQGINMMMLGMYEYENNTFLSFKQVHDIGGKVKKGEKAHMVVYWSQLENKQDGIEPVEENKEQRKKSILRYYYVFNISQCENIPDRYLPKARETKELPSCESIIAGMPQCPVIKHKEQKAYYHPKDDYVNMPKKRSFKNDESYYCTLFHELVHSTGHEGRLKRETITQMAEFGGEEWRININFI